MNVSLDPHVVWDRCVTEAARLARIPQLDLTCCRQLLKTPGLTPKVRAALKRQAAALDVQHPPVPGSKDEVFHLLLTKQITVDEAGMRLGDADLNTLTRQLEKQDAAQGRTAGSAESPVRGTGGNVPLPPPLWTLDELLNAPASANASPLARMIGPRLWTCRVGMGLLRRDVATALHRGAEWVRTVEQGRSWPGAAAMVPWLRLLRFDVVDALGCMSPVMPEFIAAQLDARHPASAAALRELLVAMATPSAVRPC